MVNAVCAGARALPPTPASVAQASATQAFAAPAEPAGSGADAFVLLAAVLESVPARRTLASDAAFHAGYKDGRPAWRSHAPAAAEDLSAHERLEVAARIEGLSPVAENLLEILLPSADASPWGIEIVLGEDGWDVSASWGGKALLGERLHSCFVLDPIELASTLSRLRVPLSMGRPLDAPSLETCSFEAEISCPSGDADLHVAAYVRASGPKAALRRTLDVAAVAEALFWTRDLGTWKVLSLTARWGPEDLERLASGDAD